MKTRGNPPGNAALRSGSPAPANTVIGDPKGKHRGAAVKKGWEIKKLSEVSDVFDGPHATPKTVDSGPIFLGIGALQDGVINLGETRHVTEENFKQWTRRVRMRRDLAKLRSSPKG
jgi:hypothetical protein